MNQIVDEDGRNNSDAPNPLGADARIEMNANGSNAHGVTNSTVVARNPVWLPHDTGIAFLSGGSVYGGGNVFVMRADGRAIDQLTHWSGRARTPQFSWTGARMLVGRA